MFSSIFPGLPSSAGFKKRGQESGRAGEWTMSTSVKPARGSAAATATVRAERSASVMKDTMVGHKLKRTRLLLIAAVQIKCLLLMIG